MFVPITPPLDLLADFYHFFPKRVMTVDINTELSCILFFYRWLGQNVPAKMQGFESFADCCVRCNRVSPLYLFANR